jgi:hypothetical protein
MFAVFENTSATWYSLPLNYRESSLYTADKDVEEMACDDNQPEGMEVDVKNTSKVVPSSSDNKVNPAQIRQKRKIERDPVKHVANITRATLQQLKELTYLSQDTDVLNDVTTELQILVAKLSATIPKSSEGIYLCGSPKKKKKRTKGQMKQKLRNIGCIPKKKKPGKKRADWWHRNRVGAKANMLRKTYKVNVPVPGFITIKDEESELFLHPRIQATADNWRDVYRNLLTPTELECLNPGSLVNDLVIEAFLQYENLQELKLYNCRVFV